MRISTALCILALTVFASPIFALTITGTSGCTTAVAGATTVSYTGQTVTDPGNDTTFITPFFDQGSYPGCTPDFLGLSGGQSTTVDFTTPVEYVGFVWGSPDGYNLFDVYDGVNLLGSYTGSDANNEYMNFTADPGQEITSVVFSTGSCCFETTNLSYVEAVIAPTVPEPGTFYSTALLLCGAWFVLRKRAY